MRTVRHFSVVSTLACLIGTAMLAAQAVADPVTWSQEGWKTDFAQSKVELARILSGGPPRDGIPSIDDPAFEPVNGHDDLEPRDPVVAVEIGSDVRAYPLRILTWHEIVNDVVGGVPVAVTYCPLCNSAPVFARTLSDGTVLTFGTTGKLMMSNLIMYDRQTESWWQQFTGEAIVGVLAGERLAHLPARLMGWAEFAAAYPDGRVLVPNDPAMRAYGRNPYVGYDTGQPFLYDGQLPEGIDPMQRVVVVERAGTDPLLVSMTAVASAGSLDIEGYSFAWTAGQASALDRDIISAGRDVGSIVVTRDGKNVAHDITFAFVVHGFHPGVTIAGQ